MSWFPEFWRIPGEHVSSEAGAPCNEVNIRDAEGNFILEIKTGKLLLCLP